MENKLLSPKALVVWRSRATIFLAAAAFAAGGIMVFLPIVSLIFSVVVIIMYILLFFVYYPMLYKSYAFGFNNQGFFISKGVILKKTLTLPVHTIQYVQLAQSPLERHYSIYTVAFHCAGSVIIISHINKDDAENISKLCNKK